MTGLERKESSLEPTSQKNAKILVLPLQRNLDDKVSQPLEKIIKKEPSVFAQCLRSSFDRIPIVGPTDRMIRAADRFYKYTLDEKSRFAETERELARRDMTSAVIEFALETF